MTERLRSQIRDLPPGYFALVMATGIVSVVLAEAGMPVLSVILLGLTAACYLALLAASGWRLARYRQEFLADLADPAKAFGLFSFVAASDVLGARLALAGYTAATLALLAAAGLVWLLLSYGMVLLLLIRRTAAAAAFWAVGVVLYLLAAGLVLAGMLQFPVDPAGLTPDYWIFMGATAISVLAGARLLRVPAGPMVVAAHPVIAGLSVMLWAFGTWLIPLLIGLGVWRHLLRKVPVRYEPSLWSMVFPLGMYCAAGHALGAALHVPWLVALGRDGTWPPSPSGRWCSWRCSSP